MLQNTLSGHLMPEETMTSKSVNVSFIALFSFDGHRQRGIYSSIFLLLRL